jgi:hypothetical protein
MAKGKRKMPAAFVAQQEKMKAKAARKHDSTSRPKKPKKARKTTRRGK